MKHLFRISLPHFSGTLFHYFMTLVMLLFALAIDLFVKNYFGRSIFFLPLAAVTCAALLGGYGPGVFAAILSAVGIDIILNGIAALKLILSRPSDLFRMLLYLPTALLITWIAGRVKRSNELNRVLNAELEAEKELRQQFVLALIHDLRNPISSASLVINLALKYPQQDALKECTLARASNALLRAEKMIQDLLEANRLTAGHIPELHFEEFDFVSTARDVLSDLERRHGRVFDLKTDSLTYSGQWDHLGIVRIFENLAENAFKYGSKTGRITISLSETNDTQWIKLSVHNYGSPIAPKDIPKLFRLYHRANDGTKNGLFGWGIGLTLVKGMAEAHGGHVDVKSSEHEGTAFVVSLPKKPTNKLEDDVRRLA